MINEEIFRSFPFMINEETSISHSLQYFLGFLQVYSSIQAFVVPEVLYSKASQYTAGDSLYIRSTSCHSRYDLYQVDN